MTKFLSKQMELIYEQHKTKRYSVYHLYWTGQGQGWTPNSPAYGYIGVSNLSLEGIKLRYNQEYVEYLNGDRPTRKLYTVLTRLSGFKTIGFDILKGDLTKRAAYDIEAFYRPERYNYADQRIWNSIPGGDNTNTTATNRR